MIRQRVTQAPGPKVRALMTLIVIVGLTLAVGLGLALALVRKASFPIFWTVVFTASMRREIRWLSRTTAEEFRAGLALVQASPSPVLFAFAGLFAVLSVALLPVSVAAVAWHLVRVVPTCAALASFELRLERSSRCS